MEIAEPFKNCPAFNREKHYIMKKSWRDEPTVWGLFGVAILAIFVCLTLSGCDEEESEGDNLATECCTDMMTELSVKFGIAVGDWTESNAPMDEIEKASRDKCIEWGSKDSDITQTECSLCLTFVYGLTVEETESMILDEDEYLKEEYEYYCDWS